MLNREKVRPTFCDRFVDKDNIVKPGIDQVNNIVPESGLQGVRMSGTVLSIPTR